MALDWLAGGVALVQWRASSPTLVPGCPPQKSSRASATCSCVRARRVTPRSSYSVCWTRAWPKLYRPGASSTSWTSEEAAAASRMSIRASAGTRVASSSTSMSKSRPMTAAVESTRSASRPSRTTRPPITSRTLAGSAVPSRDAGGDPPPSGFWRMAPVSRRWRSTSVTKNGVAVGLAVDGVGQVQTGLVEPVSGDPLHQRQHTRSVESVELQAGDALMAPERPQRLAKARRLGKLAVADRSPARGPASSARSPSGGGAWPGSHCRPTGGRRARVRQDRRARPRSAAPRRRRRADSAPSQDRSPSTAAGRGSGH